MLEIVEPHVAKRKRKDKFPHILDPEYFWILDEIVVYPYDFTFREFVEEFISSFNTCYDNMTEFIMVETYDVHDRVYMKSSTNGEDFIFVYVFKEVKILFFSLPFQMWDVNDHKCGSQWIPPQ